MCQPNVEEIHEFLKNTDSEIRDFVINLPDCTKVLSVGKATVMDHEVDAVKVKNLYGQEIVWGRFNVDRGRFKGVKLSNNAATEGVTYDALFSQMVS